jgi:uncharacterized membrane protein
LFLLSFFYRLNEVGLRRGLYTGVALLATCFAGALAYDITSGHTKVAAWRLLFLIEGLLGVTIGIVTFFFLSGNAEKAKFLTKEEQKVAKSRSAR